MQTNRIILERYHNSAWHNLTSKPCDVGSTAGSDESQEIVFAWIQRQMRGWQQTHYPAGKFRITLNDQVIG
jgi:hypothetical protein